MFDPHCAPLRVGSSLARFSRKVTSCDVYAKVISRTRYRCGRTSARMITCNVILYLPLVRLAWAPKREPRLRHPALLQRRRWSVVVIAVVIVVALVVVMVVSMVVVTTRHGLRSNKRARPFKGPPRAKKASVDIRDVQSPDFAAKRFCVRFGGASPLPFQGSTVKPDGDDNDDDDDDRCGPSHIPYLCAQVYIYVCT